MKNEQLAGARAALADFPTLKVTIGKTNAGDTITPYLASDVFTRGEDVLITPNMSKDDVTRTLRNAFAQFAAANA